MTTDQDNQQAARELLPCPFCGGEAEFLPYKRDGLTLRCLSLGCVRRDQRCGIRLSIDQLRERMAENWNSRTGAREWRFDGWPEMEYLASSGYPKLYQSRRVIVALRNGSVTFDRAESFEGKTPSWFIYPNRVVAWQHMPDHPAPPRPTQERSDEG